MRRRLYTKLHLSRELKLKTRESWLLGISARNEGQNSPSADKNKKFGMHSITFAHHRPNKKEKSRPRKGTKEQNRWFPTCQLLLPRLLLCLFLSLVLSLLPLFVVLAVSPSYLSGFSSSLRCPSPSAASFSLVSCCLSLRSSLPPLPQQATRPRTPHLHALQEIERFLTTLLLGRHCHVLVSLEETFRRRLRTVTHFMSLSMS